MKVPDVRTIIYRQPKGGTIHMSYRFAVHLARCLPALALLMWLALAPAARAQVLALDASQPFFDTSGHIQMLADPGGKLDAAQAAAAPGWTALPGNLSAGFSDAAIWLRLPLLIAALPEQGWVLWFSNALLDDVRVHVRQPDGAWQLLGHSGEDVPRARWPVDYRSPTFQFSPHSAGPQWLLIRLQSKNALATRLEVWQRLDFDNYSRREGLFFGLYFGFYLLLICVHGIFWISTRAWMSGLFLAYIGGTVLNEVLSLGLVQQITGLSVFWSDRLLGAGLALSLFIAAQVTCRQLELAVRWPRVTRAIGWLTGSVALVGAVIVGAGHYAWGVIPIQWTALTLIVMFSSMGAYLLAAGHRPARFFALAFGVFYLGVFIAFLRNLGLLPVNAWTQHAAALGTMVHMVLLGLYIIWRYERRRRAREKRQADLVAELAMQHNQRLERQVEKRTTELRDEIRRRERLEEQLRASLELERKVRHEQKEFVAMVSHEFRTPLAIIGTSAQQLGRNLDAPPERSQARCRNILDASKRLLALVNEYLTEDRIGESGAEPVMQACDLREMVHALAQEFPAGRMRISAQGLEGLIHTDPSLLRIALGNLLANADRHTPEGGASSIELTATANEIRIDVENPGAPIAADEQAKLFEKYYRGRNSLRKPGAGLGLYLVRRIADKLGGEVALVRNGEEGKIRFRLVLPLTSGHAINV